jgi:pimeloyl-ACP methyl ester carboxylesterase
MSQPDKILPLPGEVFAVNGCTAFLIAPAARSAGPQPWVWYAPTLPGLPLEEKWMIGEFLAAGVAVAGIDVGESFGSPAGRALFAAFHAELVRGRGLAAKPVLLPRSRGGLMLLNWAVEQPASVAGVAGIYPVCNLRSYPGMERACGAYGLTADELAARLGEHSPVERLAPLAAASVPFFILHGDRDEIVPLAQNSGELAARYRALGGPVELRVCEGRGHDRWEGWFHSAALVDFAIRHATGRHAPEITSS